MHTSARNVTFDKMWSAADVLRCAVKTRKKTGIACRQIEFGINVGE